MVRIYRNEDWKPLPCFFSDGDEDALNQRCYGKGAGTFDQALVVHALFGRGVYISAPFLLLDARARRQLASHRSLLRQMFSLGFAQLVTLLEFDECVQLVTTLAESTGSALADLRERNKREYGELVAVWEDFISDRYEVEEHRRLPYQAHAAGFTEGKGSRQMSTDLRKVAFRRSNNFRNLTKYIWRPLGHVSRNDVSQQTEVDQLLHLRAESLAQQIQQVKSIQGQSLNRFAMADDGDTHSPLSVDAQWDAAIQLEDVQAIGAFRATEIALLRTFDDNIAAGSLLQPLITADLEIFAKKAEVMKCIARTVWANPSPTSDVIAAVRGQIKKYGEMIGEDLLLPIDSKMASCTQAACAVSYEELELRTIREAVLSFSF